MGRARQNLHMFMVPACASYRPTVVYNQMRGFRRYQDAVNRRKVLHTERFMLPPVGVAGQQEQLWPENRKLVDYEEMRPINSCNEQVWIGVGNITAWSKAFG
jgi:hypothetical protein